jgi:hypothetical protein
MVGKECPGRDQPTGADSHNATTLDVGAGVTTCGEAPMMLDKSLGSLGWQSQNVRRYIANGVLFTYRLSRRAIRVDVDDVAEDTRTGSRQWPRDGIWFHLEAEG